jgi:hypothetical protein
LKLLHDLLFRFFDGALANRRGADPAAKLRRGAESRFPIQMLLNATLAARRAG